MSGKKTYDPIYDEMWADVTRFLPAYLDNNLNTHYIPSSESIVSKTSDGGGGGMETRVAKLEAHVENIDTNIADIRQDVRGLRAEMRDGDSALRTEMNEGFTALRTEMSSTFHWSIGIGVTFFLTIIGFLFAIYRVIPK